MNLDTAQRARVLRTVPERWEEKAEKVYMTWRPFCLAAERLEEPPAPALIELLELARRHAWNLPVPAKPRVAAADPRFWTLAPDRTSASAETAAIGALEQALELVRRGMPPAAVLFGAGLVAQVWRGQIKEPSFHRRMAAVADAGIRIFLGVGEWQPNLAPAAEVLSPPTPDPVRPPPVLWHITAEFSSPANTGHGSLPGSASRVVTPARPEHRCIIGDPHTRNWRPYP